METDTINYITSEAWLGDNGWYCYTGGRKKIIQNESSILYWMIKEPEPALPQTIRYPVPEEEY